MAEDKGSKLRPTVVSLPPQKGRDPGSAKPRIANPRVSTAAQTPVITQPTAIIGATSARIAVSAADLRKLSPEIGELVVKRALALLGRFVAERTSERKAILWGHDIQKSYGTVVEQTLKLSQSPAMRKAQGYIARMLEILGSFDLMAVATGRNEGIGRFFKGVNGKTDTLAELAAASGELEQLARLMSGALDHLLELKGELERNVQESDTIAVEAEAAALAALFLSEYLRPAKPALADIFLERSVSLTQTLAQIRSNRSVREMQLSHPVRMVAAIQHVTLVSMPDFLASLAAINSLAVHKTPLSPTEAGELNYKLHDIIQQLKA